MKDLCDIVTIFKVTNYDKNFVFFDCMIAGKIQYTIIVARDYSYIYSSLTPCNENYKEELPEECIQIAKFIWCKE